MAEYSSSTRIARKAWNPLGLFTRQEAVDLLTDRLVSQKRRVLMKDCVRIIYYCHVQRSSGCRYEMSVCIPNDPDEKLRIDDFNVHTCNPDDTRLKRRAKPQLEDFSKPIERRRPQAALNGNREDVVIPYSFSDSMTSFLNGLGDHFDVDTDLDLTEQADGSLRDCNSTSNAGTMNENLAKFISEFEESSKACDPTNRASSSKVWSTVDIDVVDFSKRPDPPFTHVFHAKDEATQYSYACPMIGNHPEVVADALLALFYQYGSPNVVRLDSSYQDTTVQSAVAEKFPSTTFVFHVETRNNQGLIVPRREEIMIRERIYAWLLENGKLNWFKHLGEIKFMHNSEWLEELGGTPMELFFGRRHLQECSRKRKCSGNLEDDTRTDTYINNSNEVRDETSSLQTVGGEQYSTPNYS